MNTKKSESEKSELKRYKAILKKNDLNELNKLSIIEINFLLKLKKYWIPAYRYLIKTERVLLLNTEKNSKLFKRITVKAIKKYSEIKPALINPLIKSAKDKKAKNDLLKKLLTE